MSLATRWATNSSARSLLDRSIFRCRRTKSASQRHAWRSAARSGLCKGSLPLGRAWTRQGPGSAMASGRQPRRGPRQTPCLAAKCWLQETQRLTHEVRLEEAETDLGRRCHASPQALALRALAHCRCLRVPRPASGIISGAPSSASSSRRAPRRCEKAPEESSTYQAR